MVMTTRYSGGRPWTALTVEASISWGQHPIRKLLHTFPSENFIVFLFSPERDSGQGLDKAGGQTTG